MTVKKAALVLGLLGSIELGALDTWQSINIIPGTDRPSFAWLEEKPFLSGAPN